MQLGMVGLGRMGAGLVRRLIQGGHQCVVTDRDGGAVKAMAGEGASGAATLEALVQTLAKPRAVWVMVPAGSITEAVINELAGLLEPGDVVIDGGNTHFKDDVRRARELAPKSIHYVDAGTSGGVFGAKRGYCLMVGGETDVVKRLDPIFATLAPGIGDTPLTPGRGKGRSSAENGYLHCGPVGSGHFVKMIHNGIEYGLMQAYAEGFDILKNANSGERPADERYDLDIGEIAELWRRGSVVSSWLLDLTAAALVEEPELARFSGFVQDSGEGRWTVQSALEEAVPADVLTAALYARFRSRRDHTFAEKVLSAMREQFGGHKEPPKTPGKASS